MQPVHPLLLLACIVLASCNFEPEVHDVKGNCKQESLLYLSTTYNGNTRTSVKDNNGQARVIFMGVNSTVFRVYSDIGSDGTQPRVMLNAVVPAQNTTGIYYADTADHRSQNVELQVNDKRYYSTNLQLNISSLGKADQSNAMNPIEYREAAGSYSGTFISPDDKDSLQVTGEFCMDDGK